MVYSNLISIEGFWSWILIFLFEVGFEGQYEIYIGRPSTTANSNLMTSIVLSCISVQLQVEVQFALQYLHRSYIVLNIWWASSWTCITSKSHRDAKTTIEMLYYIAWDSWFILAMDHQCTDFQIWLVPISNLKLWNWKKSSL